MPRYQRKQSESDVYHLILRGEARKILFEDDADRLRFLDLLGSGAEAHDVTVYAWCLMDNHVHLVVKVRFESMSRFMQSLLSGYAGYFNKRYGTIGHVFSGRYKSEPVENDEYLLTAIRYVHFNPVKGGLAPDCSYRWSSYNEYLSQAGLTETEFVLGIIGGVEQFERMHAVDPSSVYAEQASASSIRMRYSDDEALEVARELLGVRGLRELASRSKAERNQAIALMRRKGITAKQIERFTGIGRGIIERVAWRQ